jgi:DNA-binding transcriptional MerR regulator
MSAARSARERGLLEMSELAERSGVSAGTIKHYLREGLLPEPVRTSRNMAYDPPDFGFTIFDTLSCREALAPLVAEEVRTLLRRHAGEVEVERAAETVAAGAEPLRELVGALHWKMLKAELERRRGGSRPAAPRRPPG